jgi:hypothetical protein
MRCSGWLVGSILVALAGLLRAQEPDPHAEMARALEEQADVAPAPPTLATLPRAVVLPAVAKSAVAAARSDAVRAAIKAAIVDAGRAASVVLPTAAAPAAQAATDHVNNHGHGVGSPQPGPRRH